MTALFRGCAHRRHGGRFPIVQVVIAPTTHGNGIGHPGCGRPPWSAAGSRGLDAFLRCAGQIVHSPFVFEGRHPSARCGESVEQQNRATGSDTGTQEARWDRDPTDIPCVKAVNGGKATPAVLGTRPLITAAARRSSLIDYGQRRVSTSGADGSIGTVGITARGDGPLPGWRGAGDVAWGETSSYGGLSPVLRSSRAPKVACISSSTHHRYGRRGAGVDAPSRRFPIVPGLDWNGSRRASWSINWPAARPARRSC